MPYVTIKDQRMFYEDAGEGFPLLFGHSYLWDAAMWAPQVATLRNEYRCLAPELWGHGRSDPAPETPYTVADLAEDHWRLTQELGLDRFAIVGLSVGGMWGARVALDHPEAVEALVLMDTHVGPEPQASHDRYFQMLAGVEQAGRMPPPIIEAATPFFFSAHSIEQQLEIVQEFKDSLAEIPAEQIPSIVALGRGIFSRASVLERLGEITCPTLIIVGEDDRSRPPHEAQEMAAMIPHARVEIVPRAGHISTLERPEKTTSLIQEFLGEVVK